MSQAVNTVTSEKQPVTMPSPIHAARPNQVAVGTMVWLSSELMFFAGLFAMYFTLKSQVPADWAAQTPSLNIPFAAANTTVLVLSSFTVQAGLWAAERYQPRRTGTLWQFKKWGVQEWFTLTFIMGSIFIGGQMFEYAELITHGMSISTGPFASAFYMTTGFHALHVIGGLFAMLFVLARSFAARNYGKHEANIAVVVSYYWHFVDVVWVALFFIIYVVK